MMIAFIIKSNSENSLHLAKCNHIFSSTQSINGSSHICSDDNRGRRKQLDFAGDISQLFTFNWPEKLDYFFSTVTRE